MSYDKCLQQVLNVKILRDEIRYLVDFFANKTERKKFDAQFSDNDSEGTLENNDSTCDDEEACKITDPEFESFFKNEDDETFINLLNPKWRHIQSQSELFKTIKDKNVTVEAAQNQTSNKFTMCYLKQCSFPYIFLYTPLNVKEKQIDTESVPRMTIEFSAFEDGPLKVFGRAIELLPSMVGHSYFCTKLSVPKCNEKYSLCDQCRFCIQNNVFSKNNQLCATYVKKFTGNSLAFVSSEEVLNFKGTNSYSAIVLFKMKSIIRFKEGYKLVTTVERMILLPPCVLESKSIAEMKSLVDNSENASFASKVKWPNNTEDSDEEQNASKRKLSEDISEFKGEVKIPKYLHTAE